MTKDEFFNELTDGGRHILSDRQCDALDKFFSQNVCIPKGDTLQIKFNGEWDDILTVYDTTNYRIKPSEPVYEWQFIAVDSMYNAISLTADYFTLEESKELYPKYEWIHIQETKRERK